MSNQIYVPIREAAKKHNVDEEVLTQLIVAGMIKAKEEAGETLVAVDENDSGHNEKEPNTKEEIIAAKFAHLRGQPISVTEAANDYDLHRDTVLEWVKKGYITPLKEGGRGSRKELDEAEVAYCAGVYHKRGGGRGVRLFDKNGNPYQLKYPQLAEYRHKRSVPKGKAA